MMYDVAATRIATHGMHACALTPGRQPSNQIVCWGANAYGELGRGYADSAAHRYAGTASVAPFPASQLGVGGSSPFATFAVRQADGLVQGWGSNAGFRFGTSISSGTFLTAQTVPNLNFARAIAWGRYNACALRIREVFCWGWSANGNLGDGRNLPDRYVTDPQLATQLPPIVEIGASEASFCALTDRRDAVFCWGSGFMKGAVDPNGNFSPRRVTGLPSSVQIKSLSVGDGEACVVVENRGSFCWQAIRQDIDLMARAVDLGGFAATRISTSGNHRCVILANETVRCWGANTFGELGAGVINTELPLVRVTGLDSVTDISTARHTSCAIAGGFAHCWGRNDLGQVGAGTTSIAHTTPVKVQYPPLVFE